MAGIDREKAKRFERAAAELAKADKEWGRACDQLDARLESTGRDIETFRAAVHAIDAAGHEYVNALREVVPEGD